ncbi:MAG: dTMP kinase [SAR86 cluster bacterium]|uniref:Thymidylate kinase n=1 Tax=SAR86 cluster bacterium TaxID=2030880 RepID=A0A2A5B3L4_9GAMM|nr:MAG: dTMP kinase [SAR86 cluster bacterium]
MQKSDGYFITIEGIEGVGKSTNIATLTKFLEEKGVEYIVTREPGGTELAEKIRELLLEISEESITELSELLLVFAARAQHIEKLIKPALQSGKWVVCDRFTDATFAYQGGGRGLDQKIISALQSMVQDELRPDLTIILDLDPETGLERATKRGSLDRFEQEKIEFFARVRQSYLDIAAAEPQRCVVVDASKPLEAVKSDLLNMLEQKLGTALQETNEQ